ncbi:MAG: hypothetical protein IT513_18990 [Burkholderiales bacterium]|nr:hypothetical protein [Burkholderiales bacterium]
MLAADFCSMIRFLKRLFGFFAESRSKTGPQEQAVRDREDLARFLFSDKLFAKTTSRVKRHAFAPPDSGRLSVFRISELDDAAIWQFGRDAGSERGEAPRARADILAGVVRAQKLDVISAPEPHYLHANIVGWPPEKEKIRAITLELAAKAVLKLPNVDPASPA